jgi:Cu/Ag efflux pump CusA
MGFFITEPNSGDYLIQLKKDRTKSTEEVISDLRKIVEETQPALEVEFGQVITDMLGDLTTSAEPIEIKVFGDNQQTLQSLSRQIAGLVEKVKGTADVLPGIIIAGPTVSIQPHYSKIAQYGITAADLQMQIQTALEGNVIGSLLEKEQLSPIRMVYPGNRSLNVNDIHNLHIFLPNGKLIPITELASVELRPGDAEINRENLQSMNVVSARLEGSDLGTVITAIQMIM